MPEQLPVGKAVFNDPNIKSRGDTSHALPPATQPIARSVFEAEVIKYLKAQRDMINQLLRALGEA